MKRGLLLAAVHLLLALTVVAKFLVDRQTLPRVWTGTAPYDPYHPLRGRYVSIALRVDAECRAASSPVVLSVEDGKLKGTPAPNGFALRPVPNGCALLKPVAFFIPEGIPDPSLRLPGEELWVEVSVPPNGLPRPIQLGVRRDGRIHPLEIR